MRTFLRFLAVVVAIVFVVATFIVIIFQPVGSRAMRATLYKEAIAKEHIYEKLPALVGDTMRFALEQQAKRDGDNATPVSAEQQAFYDMVSQLEPQDWVTLLGAVVPPELVRAETERSLDAADAFLHGAVADSSRALSLREIKRRLLGAEAVDAYAAMLAGKPVCTDEQMERAFGLPIACRPVPERMAEALQNFQRLAQGVAEQMPDEIDLLKDLRALDGPEGGALSINQVRSTVRIAELFAQWSPAVPVALAALIALLAVRSLRGLLLWWGIPCLVAGGLGLLVAGSFAAAGVGILLNKAAFDLPPDAPVKVVEAILGVFAHLMHGLMIPALWSSVAVAGGGLLAVVVALVTRPKATSVPPRLT